MSAPQGTQANVGIDAPTVGQQSAIAASRVPAPSSDLGESDFGGGSKPVAKNPVVGSTGQRAVNMQSRIATRAPAPRLKSLASMGSYKPSGMVVEYADNKVGIMPNLKDVLGEIAEEAGVDLSDSETFALFIEAIVTDVYTNPYSDKQSFDGEVKVGTFVLPRVAIRNVIEKYVGTSHRRFARAMALTVVEVMHDNPAFAQLLDRRCTELNLSTRAEAARQFDGNEGLITLDRQSAQRAAHAKSLALSVRSTPRSYGMENSAKAMGNHANEPVAALDRA